VQLKKRFPSNKKIEALSKNLVAHWKSSLTPSTTTDKSNTNGKTTPAKKEAEGKKEESTNKRKAPSTDEKPKKKPAPSPAPRTSVGGDGGDRDKVRILLAEALGAAEEGDTWEASDASFTIEAELFTIFGSANKDYKAKFRSLSFNLGKNASLRREVLSGSLTVERLCRMTPQEMASEEEQKKRKEIEQWHLEAAKLTAPEASTDQFLCGKCKNRKCTYYQMQTRSADEPMTTFVSCTVCGNRWKFC